MKRVMMGFLDAGKFVSCGVRLFLQLKINNLENMRLIALTLVCMFPLFLACQSDPTELSENIKNTQFTSQDEELVIRPYTENPRYWQYQGKPVLLLGATNNDNLFQSADMKEQLDLLSSIGGNYIRNTMSSRDDGDIWPFHKQANGLYDLEEWNDQYWKQFEELLKLTAERNIIVQIEVWDRFDFSQEFWQLNPFNPKNNTNYSVSGSGMADDYPHHPGGDLQTFFHSLEGMPRYMPELDKIRAYQEKFVKKMLSYSLNYGHVLYCINNETNTPVEWGKYWINFINEEAGTNLIYATDMFDQFLEPQSCESCLEALMSPDEYAFVDASQLNWNNGQEHWDNLRWVMGQREKMTLRPVNSVKVYGKASASGSNGGVKRFCRDVIGGFASVRFHRPATGNGLNESAIAAIKSVRKIETVDRFWNLEPQESLLSGRESNEAYLTANVGETYVLLFPNSGTVKIDLSKHPKTFYARWISIATGEWGNKFQFEGGGFQEIATPDSKGWFVVISDRDSFE